MASKYLGKNFDIHCGDIDHIPVHHTNEIAQSDPAFGQKWVNYWFHVEFMNVDGQKMAKSAGNIFTISELEEQGFHPLVYRYLIVSTHYKTQLHFSLESLSAAKKALQRLWDFMNALEQLKSEAPNSIVLPKLLTQVKNKFKEGLDDDLNTPEAMASLFDFLTEVNKLLLKRSISKQDAKAVLAQMKEFDQVLAFLHKETSSLDEDVQKLIDDPENARKTKNFTRADEIRKELSQRGIILEDTPSGIRWKRKD